MGDCGAHLGDILVEEILGAGEILNPRTDIKRLAAAIFLTQQRFTHRDWVERRHECPHCQTVNRRRRYDREVPHSGERQLQGARDRCCGEREDVHFRSQGLQLFLVCDAEMLLLINDQ